MEYDPTTALVVVDVQNDFADPSGSLAVAGGEGVIGYINAQVDLAVDAGATIAYSQDWHPEDTPHFEKDGGIWPVHCVAGTTGAAFHPALNVLDDGIKVKKGTAGEDGYSAFSMRDPETGEESSTGLASQLRTRGVSRVVVVGLALDYCVKETALDAVKEGFETVLLADGTRPVNLAIGDGARAVAELVHAGVQIH
jgi:nicotinamidase/pyrazinamidase